MNSSRLLYKTSKKKKKTFNVFFLLLRTSVWTKIDYSSERKTQGEILFYTNSDQGLDIWASGPFNTVLHT